MRVCVRSAPLIFTAPPEPLYYRKPVSASDPDRLKKKIRKNRKATERERVREREKEKGDGKRAKARRDETRHTSYAKCAMERMN